MEDKFKPFTDEEIDMAIRALIDELKAENNKLRDIISEFMLCRKVDITMSGPLLTSVWDASRLFRLWDKIKALKTEGE
jgi:hypothetical protein